MIVVDSSAVVDALTLPEDTAKLRSRLGREDLQAPALVDFEVCSALRGLVLGGRISAARAEDALTDFDDLAVQRWPSLHQLRRRVLSLRQNLSAYDAAYVALAEVLDCSLVTRDARLGRSRGHAARIEVY